MNGTVTGWDCTKRHLHLTELQGGTTTTRRRIETGCGVTPISGLYASVTLGTDSQTSRVTTTITTLARNVQVCAR